MAQHGDLAVLHDVAYKGVAAARDDQINPFVLAEHFLDVLAGMQQRAPTIRQAARLCRGNDQIGQRLVGPGSLAPALEQHRVAAFEAERGDLHQRVRPAFKNDAHHPDGTAGAVQVQPRRKLLGILHLPKRVGQRGQGT